MERVRRARDEPGAGSADPSVRRRPVNVDSTSVMANGKDVLPAHYVTLWEALAQMTSQYLAPTDWQL